MNKKIEFKVGIFDFDRGLAEKYVAAEKALDEAKRALIDAFSKSERFTAIRDITAYHETGSKMSVYPVVSGRHIVASTYVEIDEDVQPKKYLSIGEKTINMLLSGKLLSNEEKRSLLKQHGVDLDVLSDADAKIGGAA